MKASEALREARLRIEAGSKRYICLALDCVQDKAAAKRAQRRIWSLLHPEPTLERWLMCKGVILTNCALPLEKLRQTRLNWIDDMIKYFEDRGD